MMRVTFSGPRLGKSSMSIPNFSLNLVPMAFRKSLLAGIPITGGPSFFAAARVRSHSVCPSAAGRTHGKHNTARTPNPRGIQSDSFMHQVFLWFTLLNLKPRFSFGDIIESFRLDQTAAVKHHAQKTWAAGNSMSNTTRNHRRLPGVQLHGAPLRMIERMAAKLKPNLVLVATAVKASLFLFQIINVNPELLAVVEHRSLGSAFPGHAGKIIEPSDFLDGTTAARDGADQSGGVALNPNVGLRIPESDMLERAVVFRFLSAVAVPREWF